MDLNKPMSLLLVEDDEQDCKLFENYMNTRDDVKLIGITKSSSQAIQYIKTHMPEGIILDIELNEGKGSGLEVLEELNKIKFDVKPLVAITTNISSKEIYTYAHKQGTDIIFYKLKEDYCPELVIKNLLILRKSLCNIRIKNITEDINTETIAERKERISNKINSELDLIGISSHLVGRKYIHDAILYILEENNNNQNTFTYLANKYKKGNSTIGRAIQTSIEHAWRRSSPDDLEKYYTAKVNYNTGVPTPTELIYYYVEKIKKFI